MGKKRKEERKRRAKEAERARSRPATRNIISAHVSTVLRPNRILNLGPLADRMNLEPNLPKRLGVQYTPSIENERGFLHPRIDLCPV